MRTARLRTGSLLAIVATLACGEDVSVSPDAPTPSTDHTPALEEANAQAEALSRRAAAADAELAGLVAQKHLPAVPLGGDGRLAHLVVLPAGSVDGLAAAIDAAGAGGIVVVESGLHVESATVTITQPVSILGEHGAVLEVATTGDDVVVGPALHVLDVEPRFGRTVTIWGLDIQPSGGAGNTAVLVQGTPRVRVGRNDMSAHLYGVLLEGADRAFVWDNDIESNDIDFGVGVCVINGDDARVYANDVSGALFGVWACDRDGIAAGNHFSENLIGLILCKVPAGSFQLPGGELVGSELAASSWLVTLNDAETNAWGYMVADGSNTSTLVFNRASDNAFYDIHLLPETADVFGFCTPVVFDNLVVAGHDLLVKDCGENTTLIGGTLSGDPCESPCPGGRPIAGRSPRSPADLADRLR